MRSAKLILGLAACALALACGDGAPANTAANTAAVAAATPAAQTADGHLITHAAAGIRFEVPAGWKSEADGEQFDLESGDGEVSVTFWVPAEQEFDAAAKAIGEELGKQIKNLKFDGEPKEGTHNGMDHVSVTGSGQADGKNVVFSADLLQAKKPVIVLTFASPENYKEHEAEYVKLVRSIKKVD